MENSRRNHGENKIENSLESGFKYNKEFITENPGKGVAIAAAAGALVGGILTAVFRRSKK